jgi:hypothetical protein
VTVKEEEQADVVLTPWEMELEMLEDWLNNPEQAEEHSEESLKDFSQGDELVKTAVPRYAADDEEKFQVEEQLDEAGIQPAGELAEEEAEQQFSKETAEMKSAVEWTLSSTEDKGDGMGDHCDLSICRKILQQRRLHEQSQPLEQLDEVIEKIRRLMIESAETASKEKLGREATVASSKQQAAAQQGDGADEQLQKFVWDPGGFQQLRWEAHEQELMNFAAEEYDAGASLHVNQPASQPTSAHTFNEERRSLISNLKFECN